MTELPLGDHACGSAETASSTTSTNNTANKVFHVFQNIMEHNQEDDRTMTAPFHIASKDLSVLANERSPTALADLLEVYVKNTQALAHLNSGRALYLVDDEESTPHKEKNADSYVTSLITQLRSADPATLPQTLELAATALTTVLLRSSPDGISTSPTDLEHRKSTFGANSIAPKPMTPFLVLCWDALQDFVLIMLLCMGVVSLAIEPTIGLEEGETCGACWLEGFAILFCVCIVVLVTAGIDYGKQFSFAKLQNLLLDRNTKSVLRGGEIVVVTDADIVVGDVVSVNSHSLASIPADCVLLGPCMDLKMDESSLTGESALVSKKAGDVILSGTNAVQGSGKMVVIAVGIHSVAGQIKARVYESEDQEEDGMAGDEETPLYVKLDAIAKQIAWAGTFAALFAFSISTGIGLGYHKEDVKNLIEYFIVAVTVLAVAVPEGLPLAVTLALAFSSNKMMSENNMVKTLAACETMGCATTICTDKTGTLTANKMTARAIYIANNNYVVNDPAVTLGSFLLDNIRRPIDSIIETIVKTISICTMNESVITLDDQGKETKSSGNPTEVALLHLVQNLGQDYRTIRNATAGRSDTGELADQLSKGKQVAFTSARKMMSWAVPITNGTKEGGYRIYSKGASEVILDRCDREMNEDGKEVSLTQDGTQTLNATAEAYARRGMRCLGLAYRDLPAGVNFDELSSSINNSDGSQASLCETDLVFVALVGIEDPLRKEVPDAITKCYQAGIDVRLVTGDSPNTAVSIAFQAGILKDYHFQGSDAEMVAANLKPNVLMEGKDFREKVHRTTVGGKKEFDQEGFDAIWPHLRVLARSSPDDKLTLAHGLNQSCLFEDKEKCAELLDTHNIKIFPDRQVVAMTGDGTNDAPALKRADIGFAMGIAGTQIAKDAADIILIDDNFASIVTAAKWGRNVYASIQKFLQFQLTVNIAAVGTALVGATVYQKSPLAAIQLLWVNLLMDALASLALASEPPKKELLMRNPVNRSEPMITNRMWTNMIGQASYQILITMLLLFLGPGWFDIPPGDYVEKELKMNSVHYTIIFNAFVWMQLFNEINSRNLKGEVNVFKGLFKNKLFMGILVGTSILQVIMVQLGGKAMHVVDGGLEWKYWGICMGIGFGSLPVQQVINVVYNVIAKGSNKEKSEAQVEYHEGGELSPAIVE